MKLLSASSSKIPSRQWDSGLFGGMFLSDETLQKDYHIFNIAVLRIEVVILILSNSWINPIIGIECMKRRECERYRKNMRAFFFLQFRIIVKLSFSSNQWSVRINTQRATSERWKKFFQHFFLSLPFLLIFFRIHSPIYSNNLACVLTFLHKKKSPERYFCVVLRFALSKGQMKRQTRDQNFPIY